MDFSNFHTPQMKWRPAPFWAINDRLDPAECSRQVTDMLNVGLSGVFFHSRSGLVTDYLGDEWFAALDASLATAKAGDGFVWLYDEDRWPSGNAGGMVAALEDEFRAAFLQAELIPADCALNEYPVDTVALAAYIISRDNMVITSIQRVTIEEAAVRTDVERLILIRKYEEKGWYWNGESSSNLLNPKAVLAYLQMTHDKYAEHYRDDFDGAVPGMFTDEPAIRFNGLEVSWYDGLPEIYLEWTGRDLWADLPYLFFDGADCRAIRLLIHRTINRQFTEAYTKQIFDWCEVNHLPMTGHFVIEDTLEGQLHFNGGPVMPHYRYEHIPGVDHLSRETDEQLLTHKQVNSAARQLGRKRVLTELFGVSRHTNTFADFRWIGDFNLVFGSNFFCPHLSLYSARGRRKRDYPPNWNYQQSYWNELRPLNDYFARVGDLLAVGEAKVDILLLHPIDTAMAGHRMEVKSTLQMPSETLKDARDTERLLRRSLDAILNAGFDCDLGDETYLAEMGEVVADQLRIGMMHYRVIVVPPAYTWRPTTLALLQQFAAAGGKLIFLGALPTEVDCVPAQDIWVALAAQSIITPCAREQIQEAIAKVAAPSFTLRDEEGQFLKSVYLQHRVDGEQQLFFIVNNSRHMTQHCRIILLGGAKTPLGIWDALSATRSEAKGDEVAKDLCYSFTLPPMVSIILVAGEDALGDEKPLVQVPDMSNGHATMLPAAWNFSRSEENVLVLDRLSASIDGGHSWLSEDMDFRVRTKLVAHFGLGEALWWQPWVAIRKGIFDRIGGPVTLRYRFTSELANPRAALVIEDITKGTLTVNGAVVTTDNPAWHWDHDFGKVDISQFVVAGENVVDFTVDYDFQTEVEPAYIVGDFGVRLSTPYEGVIISEPGVLRNGSWQEQGYPFYSGTMTYSTTFPAAPQVGLRTFLRLRRASGILFKVRLNGSELENILWRPHVVELTNALNPGENTLQIDVISSRQNSLGPLHEKEGDDNTWCGPNAFDDERWVRDEFSLFDYGLLDGAEIVQVG